MALIFIDNTLEYLGIPVLNTEGASGLILRFVFNLLVSLFIIRYIYYPKTKRRDFLFTFLLIGQIIFLMCFLLESVKLQVGFALGLFAVFGIIRYRTAQIPIKEMTYLFLIIGLAVINSLANKKVSYFELFFANGIIMLITWFIERLKNLENESYANVLFEKIELVKPEHKEELYAELESRLGLKISRIEIVNLDYQRDVAKIHVYFVKSDQSWGFHEDIDYKTISNEFS
jgi:hypothetical protein